MQSPRREGQADYGLVISLYTSTLSRLGGGNSRSRRSEERNRRASSQNSRIVECSLRLRFAIRIYIEQPRVNMPSPDHRASLTRVEPGCQAKTNGSHGGDRGKGALNRNTQGWHRADGQALEVFVAVVETIGSRNPLFSASVRSSGASSRTAESGLRRWMIHGCRFEGGVAM
jgi:hypothetical protein